uniref:serine/threonine-protein phosphatase 7 long form homolog n=1 Tax=Erigeron canadensis TaxID=72917 RepID=UPI001CB91AD3|nr:serine/threonine-protein phosphatase 7 long form homolog [Erigeron canadensis]
MLEDTIMEEREELMLSLKPSKTHDPTRKLGLFLKPTSTLTNHGKPFDPTHCCEEKMCSLRVLFKGWRTQQKGWKDWVDGMHSLHKSTWKKAGIYEAVLNSCYEIKKDDNLILGFVQKWCDETKSFVFSWGEVTVTLEDMMVIGGYSVLGDSVDCAIVNEDMERVLEKLMEVRTELTRSSANKADQTQWMKKFKDSGSDIEHEAFLVLWLCRFVFPSSSAVVMKDVLTIGIHLARGVKLALAPAVLASIYRDLSLLKTKMVGFKDDDHNDKTVTAVWAPFQLVQVWIWERFCKLRPNPGHSCSPRFAKWGNKLPVKDVSSFVGSALEEFCWQPYGEDLNDHSLLSKLYQDVGRWVVLDVCLDEGLESWARCSRVSELVGIDGNCIEQYLPHRVAMQFGMNQDVPGDVARTNETSEVAWNFYSRPVTDAKLYIPSRVSEPHVTARYLEWSNKSTGSCSQLCDDEGKNLVKNELRTEGSEDAMGNNDAGGGSGDDEINALGLKLEARIGKLEEVFQYLKAKKQKVI